MSSDWTGTHRFQFDEATPSAETAQVNRLETSIDKTVCYLFDRQHTEGYWEGELDGDSILESELIFLKAYLGELDDPIIPELVAEIRRQQRPEGGWAIYPGGPLDISPSVKAYLALKICGISADEPEMIKHKETIRRAGGVENVNSFTRFHLALLGLISYQSCPAVPPEMLLLPSWSPLRISDMSAWSRTLMVPLSLIWSFQPHIQLPPEARIDELFLKKPGKLSLTMPTNRQLDPLKRKWSFPWTTFFRTLDWTIKGVELCRLMIFRKQAIEKAKSWILTRFKNSDGLGAIFPPIAWSWIALKCLGYDETTPEIKQVRADVEKLIVRKQGQTKVQPCQSPVWDTAIASLALREAGVRSHHRSIRRAVDWLLSKEVRQFGDWAENIKKPKPGGWAFEHNNPFYPDVDDTCMVVMALARALPGDSHHQWLVEYLREDPIQRSSLDDPTTLVTGQTENPQQAIKDVNEMQKMIQAIWRGANWVIALQSQDGGWGAFDANNNKEILTRVPFADHNAMIDPSTADITARVLEMFGLLGLKNDHPWVQKAVRFIWLNQERDGSWYGRWGVNYIYGTAEVLIGLAAIGVPTDDPRVQAGVRWLKQTQQENGGWGESPLTYEKPDLKGLGPTTASQTAWALLGLLAIGEIHSRAAARGVQYLLETQADDGSWPEEEWTGTGFPRVFYLKYHLYSIYFPLLALARYQRLLNQPNNLLVSPPHR